MKGWPTGPQPWLTTTSSGRSRGRRTTTAPRSCSAPSSTSRLAPAPNPPDASPPTTVSWGWLAPSELSTASTGNEAGSASSTAVPASSRSAPSTPTRAAPSSVSTTWTWWAATAPVVPAHSDTAGTCSASEAPPMTDTAVAPTRVPGCRRSRTVRAMSSSTPVWGAVTKSTARSGAAPSCSRTSPTTSPVAWVASGCSEMAAAKGIAQSTGASRVNGTTVTRAHVDPAVGLHGAVVVEGQLGPDQAVVELPRLDLQRLHVAGQLLLASPVDHLQGTVGATAGGAVHDHAQVGLDRDRHRRWGRRGELHPGQVDPGRGARHLAQVDAVDEQGGEDVHGPERTGTASSARGGRRVLCRHGDQPAGDPDSRVDPARGPSGASPSTASTGPR